MKINTVGRIILKDGMLVFERFGAAVARKVKLGTSAFANIVNNATTTEEGFVPDARVVAQQQETISALQEQVDSLNSAMENHSTMIPQRFVDSIFTEFSYWNVSFRKSGNVVTMTADINGIMKPVGDYTKIFEIPEGYRPTYSFTHSFISQFGNTMGIFITTKDVRLYNVNKEVSDYYIRQVITYII